jgi:hypothetical protein
MNPMFLAADRNDGRWNAILVVGPNSANGTNGLGVLTRCRASSGAQGVAVAGRPECRKRLARCLSSHAIVFDLSAS